MDDLAGHPTSLVGGEPGDEPRGVVGLAAPARREAGPHRLQQLGRAIAGVHRAGVDGVERDAAIGELVRYVTSKAGGLHDAAPEPVAVRGETPHAEEPIGDIAAGRLDAVAAGGFEAEALVVGRVHEPGHERGATGVRPLEPGADQCAAHPPPLVAGRTHSGASARTGPGAVPWRVT